MKKLSFIAVFIMLLSSPVFAGYDKKQFKTEVLEGLDLISVRENIDNPDAAPGELGLDVYQSIGISSNDNVQLFVPASMYLRLGGGFNLGFATDKAVFNGREYESSGSWTTQIGLGWNLSSYVRTEMDVQLSTFNFSDLDGLQADYQTFGGMLYFDFARRYVMQGDITYRRVFVPFIGIGAGIGYYSFDGNAGAGGVVFATPRASLGFNIMITDLIGIDIMYQYQMMVGNGFGWNVDAGGVDNISNIMATFRVNF